MPKKVRVYCRVAHVAPGPAYTVSRLVGA
jgi:hypothetical protein